MNNVVWKNLFSKQYFKLCKQTRIHSKSLFISSNFCAKKYKIKNKFVFEEDFKRNILKKVNSKKEILSDHNDYEDYNDQHSDNSYLKSQGFVSGEIQIKPPVPQSTKLSTKTKVRKPSLTYQGEILFGVHPVYLALLQKKRVFYHLYANEEIDSSPEKNNSRKGDIIRIARSMDIPVSYVDSRGLKILAPGAVHQGVCLDAGFLPVSNWVENQCEFNTNDVPLWLVLDEILDPMNVGAIIRSAYYFGVDKIFTVRGNSCKLSPTVSKASSGALEIIDICQIGNLQEFVENRKSSGWQVVSTVAYSNDCPELNKLFASADHSPTSKPTILILGNEGKGISEEILKLCDSLISIEPAKTLLEGTDSLNVSVAAGILLYALNNLKKNK